jgi:3-deoxy-7-phosphoheptulonate synthase
MGADGLLIEVHPNPAEALSDGQQQVDFRGFQKLMADLEPLLRAVGRTI